MFYPLISKSSGISYLLYFHGATLRENDCLSAYRDFGMSKRVSSLFASYDF